MSKKVYEAATRLVREVNAHLDYEDDADMGLANDALWETMTATGAVNPALAQDLIAEVDAHLDYEDDADMQKAVDRLRGLLPAPTPEQTVQAEVHRLRAAAESLCEKVDDHLEGWDDKDMEADRDALRASMAGGGAVDHALLEALVEEVEAQLAVEDIDPLKEAVERVRKLVPAPESAPAP